MWTDYNSPILPFGQFPFLIICVVLIAIGFFLYQRRQKFLLVVGIFIGAWQGGYWVNVINMDIRLVYIVFLAIFILGFYNKKGKVKLPAFLIRFQYAWLLLIFWSIIAITQAIDANAARGGTFRFLIDIAIFWVIIKLIKKPADLKYLAFGLTAALIGQSLLALVQFKVPYFKFGVIDEVASWMWWRARGTFFHANHLGMFFVILLPVALRSAISFLLAKNQKFFYISISAFLLGLVALMTTYNRGSWIGFGSGMVVMFSLDLLSRKSKIKKIVRGALIIGVFLGIFVSIKFGGMIIDRVLHSDQKEIMEGREQLQEEAIDTIQQHPVFGVGYFNDRYYSKVIFAHNLYLLVATEVGVPGFIFFAWFLLELLWLVIRGCRSKIPFVYNYSRGLLASLVGFMIASLPGPDFWINEDVQFYFWVVVAITVSLLRMEHKIVTEAEKLIMRKRKAMQMETFPQENYSLS